MLVTADRQCNNIRTCTVEYKYWTKQAQQIKKSMGNFEPKRKWFILKYFMQETSKET